MQLEKHSLGFDLLVIGMCILSQVLLVVWCTRKPRKTVASGQEMEGDGLRLGGVAGWALITVVGLTLLLLLIAILNFSHQLSYLFFLILGFFVCGMGISFAFRTVLGLRWERPWLDVCKLVVSAGLLWFFAWGIKYLVLAVMFWCMLFIHGPWVRLAK